MQKLIASVEEHLESPYGIEMLGPPFTKMREDVGRVTQKFPGSAENGSIYNHAAAFYVYGLYSVAENDRAYQALRKMIPGPNLDDILQRGQLPVFVPNYYRGAFKQYPRTAGRSSQLFNTGTAHWIYRSILDGLFGLSGCRAGLKIDPQIPSFWAEAKVTRQFRGAEFQVEIIRDKSISETEILVDGELIQDKIIQNIIAGKTYKVLIKIAG
jgi:cellobionic acid phosphorylase